MPNTTEKYGLKKPLPEEFYDVNVQNENMDIIDRELQKIYRESAPKDHSSPDTDHGIGTGVYYGHVQLSDAVDSDKNVNDGVAASPKAVKTAYDLANGKAPANHASAATTYGIGTNVYFGHVQLSDSTTSNHSVYDGIAATPNAVYAVYRLANSKAPQYQYGTEDLTAGVSELDTGRLYFVFE